MVQSELLKLQSAVVTLSGGQDSSTLLFWAKRTFGEVIAVSFSYGQKHTIELEKAKKIAKIAGVEHHILDVSLLNQLAPNALTRVDIEVPNYVENLESEPSTVVRGRNGLFAWITSIFASTHNISNIVLGVCQTDFSGYIDCRDMFVKSLQTAINLGVDEKIVIHTPLMWLNKVETWQMADELGVLNIIENETHTCYQGVEGGCHTCPSCVLRERSLVKYKELKKKHRSVYGENILRR